MERKDLIMKKVADKHAKGQINFKKLIHDAKPDEHFTKEETIIYLRSLMEPLLKEGLTLTLNDGAVSAIKEELKGNMALHLGSITLEQVVLPAPVLCKKDSSAVNYEKAAEAIYKFMYKKEVSCSFKDIQNSLKEQGISFSSTQWAYFRNSYLKNTDWGKKIKLVMEEGTSKKSARWFMN